MDPPSKRKKVGSGKPISYPLSSVLEWFDTTIKPSTILCREKEKMEISGFIHKCIEKEKGGSFYACGSPGIGKSLLIKQILDEMKTEYGRSLKNVYINAMTLQKNQEIYSLLADLLLNEKKPWGKAKLSLEENLLRSTRKQSPIILCIDEIDHLLTKERSIVYDLFEWPYLSKHVIIMIGIANSVDLIERSLPLLKIGNKKKPPTMVFPSYTSIDLVQIIQQRCDLCNESLGSKLTLFQPTAIELCSKKVAEMGDARRLLDICKTVLQNVFDGGIVTSEGSVNVPQMSRVLFQFFRSNNTSIVTELPRMAQVLLACLCGVMKEMENRATNLKLKNQSKVVSSMTLRSVYVQVQKNIMGGLRPSVTDFNVIFDQLIHNGLCKVVQATRLKPADRPILMLTSVDELMDELKQDIDFGKVINRCEEFMK